MSRKLPIVIPSRNEIRTFLFNQNDTFEKVFREIGNLKLTYYNGEESIKIQPEDIISEFFSKKYFQTIFVASDTYISFPEKKIPDDHIVIILYSVNTNEIIPYFVRKTSSIAEIEDEIKIRYNKNISLVISYSDKGLRSLTSKDTIHNILLLDGAYKPITFLLYDKSFISPNIDFLVRKAIDSNDLGLILDYIRDGLTTYKDVMFLIIVKDNLQMLIKMIEIMKNERLDYDFNHGLTLASSYGALNIAEFLLSNGVDNYSDVLRYASANGNEKMLYLVLNSDHKFNVSNYEEALTRAAAYGHLNIVKILDPYTEYNYEALNQAAETGYEDIVIFLLNRSSRGLNEALKHAARSGHINIINLLIDNGANDLNSALEEAAKNGHVYAVMLVLAKGAKEIERAMMFSKNAGYMTLYNLLEEWNKRL